MRVRDGQNEAKDIYLRLLKDDPNNVRLLMKASKAIYHSDCWGYGDENAALMFSLAEKAVQLQPDSAETHDNLGHIMHLYGEPNETYLRQAAREYELAIRLNSTYAGAVGSISIMSLMWPSLIRFSVDEVVDLFEKAIEANSERETKRTLLRLLGQYHQYKTKDQQKMVEAFRAALSYWDEDNDPKDRTWVEKTVKSLSRKRRTKKWKLSPDNSPT